MTKDGKVNLSRVELVMKAIGRMEDSIFKRRREDECRRRIRDEKRKTQNRNNRKFGAGARNETPQVFNDLMLYYFFINLYPDWTSSSANGVTRTKEGTSREIFQGN